MQHYRVPQGGPDVRSQLRHIDAMSCPSSLCVGDGINHTPLRLCHHRPDASIPFAPVLREERPNGSALTRPRRRRSKHVSATTPAGLSDAAPCTVGTYLRHSTLHRSVQLVAHVWLSGR